jgi:hypothetical protein
MSKAEIVTRIAQEAGVTKRQEDTGSRPEILVTYARRRWPGRVRR